MEESAYELQRQQNILKNQALLQQLQLASHTAPTKKRAPPSTARTKREPRTPAPAQPRRTSSRLAGIPAEKRQLSPEITETTTDVKRRRRVDDDILFSMGDAKIVDITSAPSSPSRSRSRSDANVDVDALRTRFGRLALRHSSELPKLTPERSYHLDFHPTASKPLVFSGDKTGVLGILSAGDADAPDVTRIALHARTISSFAFDPANAQRLVSASYDGTLRDLDLDRGKAVQVFALPDPDSGLSAVQILGDRRLLWASLAGEVGAYDPRADKGETWECAEKKIGCVAGARTGYKIATASLDRTVKLWDLRSMAEPIVEHENRLSVSSAYFNAAGEVVTTSYDDTVKIYTPDLKVRLVLRHNNQTGRWVTIFKANWQEEPTDGRQKVCVANMGKWIDVIDAETGIVVATPGRSEEILTAVPAACRIHPKRDWVAGATASGKVVLFM